MDPSKAVAMDLGLQDRIVFVAGSSRGIGLGIVQRFLDEGARVVVTGRDTEVLRATVFELAGRHGSDRVLAVAGDLMTRTGIAAALLEVEARWRFPDAIIANIGNGSSRPGWEVEPAEWERLFAVNFWSAVYLAEAALPRLVARGTGSIVFITSIVGREAVNAPLPYSAAKAALIKYTKTLSRAVAGQGVQVNCIAPGNIYFPGGSWDRKLQQDAGKVDAYLTAEVPLARFGRPEEIGTLATFLCSPLSGFITGACLVADGGQTRSL
jgi:3-oxoacyl-[acyl-carrier protein] reductase